MDLLPLALAFAAITAGSVVQGAVGFGAALISAPLLLLIDPHLVPGPATIAGVLLSILMIVREPNDVDFRGLGWAIAGLPAGTLVAAYAITVMDRDALALVGALLVLAAVAISAFGLRLTPSPHAQLAAGVTSGFMATTAAIGGPPIALLHQHTPAPAFRATLARFFVASAGITLLVLGGAGKLGTDDIWAGLILAPASAVGFMLAGPLRNRVNGPGLRHAVLVISALSATAVLARLALA